MHCKDSLKRIPATLWAVASRWLLLFALAGVVYHAVFYMHRQVTSYESVSWYLIRCNHLMMVWDACLVALVYAALPLKNGRWMSVPLFLVGVYTIGNALFTRNIGGYMPLSAWLEHQNLNGLGGSILSSFRWPDYVMMSALLGVALLSVFYKGPYPRYKERVGVLATLLALLTAAHLHTAYVHADSPQQWRSYEFSPSDFMWNRESYIFTHGVFWSACHEVAAANTTFELTPDEQAEVERALQRPPFTQHFEKPRHVIFVVVESLVSDPIDQVIDGTEVTPTLNRLKREGLYGGAMKSEVKYGESSDGQFIYFTGLLPKLNGVTVFDNIDNEVHGLGTAALEAGYQTILLNATGRTFWRKHLLCPKYGIDHHYAPDDYGRDIDPSVGPNTWLNDEQIFHFAHHLVQKHKEEPIFMTILTLSTHVPYNVKFDEALCNFPSVEDSHYACYLQKLNYMDAHFGRFLERLEADGLLDDMLFVVVSDHTAPDSFGHADKRCIPLFITGKGIDHQELRRPLRQIDVYPTMLNLFGYDHRPYMGLGRSVFDADELQRVPQPDGEDSLQRVSNLIIASDYWKKE